MNDATLTLPETTAPAVRALWRERLAGLPYVLPAVLVIISVMSYPFVYSIYLSFRATPSYTTETHFAGLANYAAVLSDPVFRGSLLVTIIWTFGCTVMDIVLGMGAALVVENLRWFRGPIRAALMLPYIVGYVIASYAWLWLYQAEYGLLNEVLTSWHIIEQPISLLSSLTWALPAVMLVNIWKTMPFAMIMFLAGLQTIPEQTVLAAELDGASHTRVFFEVKLPYLRRVLGDHQHPADVPELQYVHDPLHHDQRRAAERRKSCRTTSTTSAFAN